MSPEDNELINTLHRTSKRIQAHQALVFDAYASVYMAIRFIRLGNKQEAKKLLDEAIKALSFVPNTIQDTRKDLIRIQQNI